MWSHTEKVPGQGVWGRAASGGALAPDPPRATRRQPEFRGALDRTSQKDGANRGVFDATSLPIVRKKVGSITPKIHLFPEKFGLSQCWHSGSTRIFRENEGFG